jgi:hypothetical protein
LAINTESDYDWFVSLVNSGIPDGTMRVIKLVVVVTLLVMVASCDKEQNQPTRSFYMGFTPMPYEVSLEGVDYIYNKISTHADIIDHHFDNGVPWVEAYEDKPFHENIINDWNFRKEKTPANQVVYVSVSALRTSRDSIAFYRGANDDMPLPKPWNKYKFSDEPVKTAYLNYCKRLITFFNPKFFNMNVEANLLYYFSPSQWSSFMEFHQFVYSELKKTYPELTIFSSVTGAHIMPGFFEGNDFVQQRLAVLQVVEYSDLYALSFYPYLSGYLGNPFPENTFDELFNISDKPLAIAETGYPAQTFGIKVNPTTEVSIISDPEKQNKYFNDLFKAAQKRKALFVINFVLRDYDPLWNSIGSKNDLTIAWRDTGLYDENAVERPSAISWKNVLGHHHANEK